MFVTTPIASLAQVVRVRRVTIIGQMRLGAVLSVRNTEYRGVRYTEVAMYSIVLGIVRDRGLLSAMARFP